MMTPLTVPPRFVTLLDELERFDLTPRDRDEARHRARFAISAPAQLRKLPLAEPVPVVAPTQYEQALKAPEGLRYGARPPSGWLRAARDLMVQAEAEGCRSYSAIARWMTERGHESARGGSWTQVMVGRVFDPNDEKRTLWATHFDQEVAQAWELAEAATHESYTDKAAFFNERGLRTERGKAWTRLTVCHWHSARVRGSQLRGVVAMSCAGIAGAALPPTGSTQNDFAARLESFEAQIATAVMRAKAVGARSAQQFADFLNGLGLVTFYGEQWDGDAIRAWQSVHG